MLQPVVLQELIPLDPGQIPAQIDQEPNSHDSIEPYNVDWDFLEWIGLIELEDADDNALENCDNNAVDNGNDDGDEDYVVEFKDDEEDDE